MPAALPAIVLVALLVHVSALQEVLNVTVTVECGGSARRRSQAFGATHDQLSSAGSTADMSCTILPGIQPDGFAWGQFRDTILEDGWSHLEIWTAEDAQARRLAASGQCQDPRMAAAFAVGCVEGALTQGRVYQMVTNAKANMFPGGSLPFAAQAYLGVQVASVRAGIATHYQPSKPKSSRQAEGSSTASAFWSGMAVLMAHFDGLAFAYNATAPMGQNVSALDLYAVSR